jgi:hypothetical protein
MKEHETLDEQWDSFLSKYKNPTEFLSKRLVDECFNIDSDVNVKPFIGIKFVFYADKKEWGAVATYKGLSIHIPSKLLNLDESISIYHQKSKVYAALLYMLKLPCLSHK